jgi:hypothetical protein
LSRAPAAAVANTSEDGQNTSADKYYRGQRPVKIESGMKTVVVFAKYVAAHLTHVVDLLGTVAGS